MSENPKFYRCPVCGEVYPSVEMQRRCCAAVIEAEIDLRESSD